MKSSGMSARRLSTILPGGGLAAADHVSQSLKRLLTNARRIFTRAKQFFGVIDDAKQLILHDDADLFFICFSH